MTTGESTITSLALPHIQVTNCIEHQQLHEHTSVSLQDLSPPTVYVILAQDLMLELQSGSRVWAVDLLGQGRSWPQQAPEPEHKLAFSVDTWTAQIADFIRCIQALPVIHVSSICL